MKIKTLTLTLDCLKLSLAKLWGVLDRKRLHSTVFFSYRELKLPKSVIFTTGILHNSETACKSLSSEFYRTARKDLNSSSVLKHS